MTSSFTRREFLRTASAVVAGSQLMSLSMLRPISAATNPLEYHPDRDWEKLHRDVYAYDDSFIFMCAPNCTHNCYLRAHVKNGIVTQVTARY